MKNTIELDKNNIPSHVGIIMDGNGRWAKNRNMLRTKGHEEGLKRAKEVTKLASDLGISYLTLYVFSTENWKRTEQEVGFLMNLIHTHLIKELLFYKENQIRIKLLGDITGLPKSIQADIKEAEADTENFSGLTLNLAINYGGRNEIIRALKKIYTSDSNLESITENTFSKYFDVPELPDLDLLIRTGGEKRLSNFLMWHSAYAELVFSDTLWPEYTENCFINDLIEFQQRTRRFGAVIV
ncbi:MAG: di-trans,poly-cis-decaprenylcistransferase [Treponema sp.]|nr:di-trans,poly-cis-decaprenylcistransferase [Treponema sp.]